MSCPSTLSVDSVPHDGDATVERGIHSTRNIPAVPKLPSRLSQAGGQAAIPSCTIGPDVEKGSEHSAMAFCVRRYAKVQVGVGAALATAG